MDRLWYKVDMVRTPSRAERSIIKHVVRQVLVSGMTEREIARKAGWHDKKVRRLLTGETELGAVEMRTFARVLRRPVGELFPPEQRRAA